MQFVAGVGDELPHPQIGPGPLSQCRVHVVEHVIQRQPDDADLALRVGVTITDPRRDPVVVGLQGQRGHLPGDRGDPSQGTQRVTDEDHRRQRRQDQGHARHDGDHPGVSRHCALGDIERYR